MLQIGLTGGIAAGKSTIAGYFAELGAAVIDADAIAREVVAAGTPGLAGVAAEFGASVLAPDGSLDRAALARIVFGNAAALARLNAIVHPLVAAQTKASVAALPRDAVVVHDVPLIVENGLGAQYHLVIVVGVSEAERVRRLVTERGMTEAEARARIAAQANDEARRRAADIWINNDRDRAEVRAEVAQLWRARIAPFERNLLQAAPAAERKVAATLLEPPAGAQAWAVQAERILERLRRACGDRVLDAEHIGSTAVAGLVAKDRLDLQLGVASLADADALAPALARAGFPVQNGFVQDTPKPADPDPTHWLKRFHANSDPGRSVNLHVRVVGSPGWRYALDFRDWLRSDAQARAEYADLKRSLAAAHALEPTTRAYAEAKEPWFTHVWPRVQAWAASNR